MRHQPRPPSPMASECAIDEIACLSAARAGSTGAPRSGLDLCAARLFRSAAYVDGAWAREGEPLAVTNPATGERLGTVPDLGAEGTQRAVEAAARAFPEWRATVPRARGASLRRWANLMLDHAEDLARLMTAEQGKPLAEARGEVVYAASFLDWFAEEARRIDGSLPACDLPDRRILVRREPVGIVAAITPWNFPLAMITRKAGPALAAGCTLVLKPSELTPLSALALAELGQEAGLPAGVFNVVTGAPGPIGDVLTSDPRVRKFTFTGSTAVGTMLAARCMSTVKRVSLELGGSAPFLVFDDADLDAAVAGLLANKFRNAGQTCVCANRILVQQGVHGAFVRRLAAVVASLKVGDGSAPETDVGPLISVDAAARVRAHVEDALEGGAIAAAEAAGPNAPQFVAPLVLTNVTTRMRIAREETFGPVAPIIRFKSEREAVAIANDTPYGLAAYLYTQDASRIWRLSEALEFGMVGLNSGAVSLESAPFGGMKQSGLGREGGREGIGDYLECKTLHWAGLGAAGS